MLALVAGALSLIAIGVGVAKFAMADGDFTLLSQGGVKRERVEGKVIWITGASRGIGEVLAVQFARLGAKLILSARNVADLERVKIETLGKHPGASIEILPFDLASDEKALKDVVQKAESLFPCSGVDYMVHNAAFERPKRKAVEETEEGLQATFKINVMGTLTLTKLVTPFMLKRGEGHFVVVSSAAAKCPAPGQAIYSASKHALNGYFNSLRSELCHEGIKVTVVCPGPIETYKTSGAGPSHSGSSERRHVSSERCAELIIVAATSGLKEAWISCQPVLLVMYLMQYVPTVGLWFVDKVGRSRLEAAERKGDTYSWRLFFGGKRKKT